MAKKRKYKKRKPKEEKVKSKEERKFVKEFKEIAGKGRKGNPMGFGILRI